MLFGADLVVVTDFNLSCKTSHNDAHFSNHYTTEWIGKMDNFGTFNLKQAFPSKNMIFHKKKEKKSTP